jgi:integrase
MEPKLEKRNEAGGERAVEKPLRGKVHTTDFFTSIGNPPNPRISTFPQPRRRRLVIFYLEDWRTKTQTRPRPRVTYRKPKMVLTMGSTLVLNAWLHEPQRGNGNLLFPSAVGKRLTVHGVQYLLNKHRMVASKVCPSLKHNRVTVHRLRHTMAMDLLQAGVDRSVIALWLGHESVETTQIYLEATLAMKEQALAKTTPPHGRATRYHPSDQLLEFLNSL